MKFNKLIGVVILSLIFFSCSKKTAFTAAIQKEYQFPESKVEKIQFTTSKTFWLVKTDNEMDANVKNGVIIDKRKKRQDGIKVKKGTPCTLYKILDENKFLFSFEQSDSDGRVLLFGNNGSGYYSIMAKEWKGNTGIGIPYGSSTYTVTNGDVFLNVKIKKTNSFKGRKRTLKGKKV